MIRLISVEKKRSATIKLDWDDLNALIDSAWLVADNNEAGRGKDETAKFYEKLAQDLTTVYEKVTTD